MTIASTVWVENISFLYRMMADPKARGLRVFAVEKPVMTYTHSYVANLGRSRISRNE